MHLPGKTFLLSIWLLSLFFISNPANARDLHGRFGLGYNAEFANASLENGRPAVSMKYGFTRDIAAAFLLGMSTSEPKNSLVGLKLFKNLFIETDLNFYAMLGAGILSAEEKTGTEFLGGFGAEFFIPGLESLGFSFETGASLTNIKGSFVVSTIGVSFIHAGMHFYF